MPKRIAESAFYLLLLIPFFNTGLLSFHFEQTSDLSNIDFSGEEKFPERKAILKREI